MVRHRLGALEQFKADAGGSNIFLKDCTSNNYLAANEPNGMCRFWIAGIQWENIQFPQQFSQKSERDFSSTAEH